MSAAAAPSAVGGARPRLGWLTLALFVAALVAWGGAVSVERESVRIAAATTKASQATSMASIAASSALETHSNAELDLDDAKFDHPAALATLVPLEARLKREQDATYRALVEASDREDKLKYGRRFALERLRDDLVACSAFFSAAALITGVAGAQPWSARWTGYALAAGVLAWGVLASAARVWDKVG